MVLGGIRTQALSGPSPASWANAISDGFGWFLAYPPRSIGKVVGEIREFGPERYRGRYNS